MDFTKELPTVLSLCSGYGGIERGLELAGFKHTVIAFSEIEAYAIANLVNKMEAGELLPAPIYTNLKTLPAHLFRDRVDLITGGYPCQPFSTAGKRKGTDDPRHLWPYIRGHIESIRPVRCFFENVEGHISLGLREVIADLESLGYQTTWGIFSAREVGAPHQRKRVYILADSSGAGQQTLGNQSERKWEEGFTGKSSELADPIDKGLQGREWLRVNDEKDSRGKKSEHGATTECGNGSRARDLADTNSAGRKQSNQEDARQPPEQSYCGGVQPRGVPNTDNTGLERRLQRSQPDQIGRQKQTIRCATECSDRGSWNGHSAWPPEPQLGRVAHGIADRVDRIRMLGNGIVPQTAAKAWSVLSKRMEITQ